MIWTEVDFEREVRRQLIELRSLRKRVPADREILQHIERLEASHHGILRKLGEFFRTQEEPHRPGEHRPGEHRPGEHRPGEHRPGEHRPGEHRPVTDSSDAQEQGTGTHSGNGEQITASSLALSSARTREDLPSLTEVCACCGKLLISSLLAGGEIQRDSGAWFHVQCLEREKPIARRDTLN